MPIQDEDQVWRGLLEADRLARYYGQLAERFSRWSHRAMWAIVVSSFALVGMSATEIHIGLTAVPSFIVAALALWLSYTDYSRKSGVAACIAGQCTEIAKEWEYLWFDMDAEDATARAKDLDQRITRVTIPALHEGGFLDEKLNARCNKETNEYWTAALAA